jgi:hypothetical protein
VSFGYEIEQDALRDIQRTLAALADKGLLEAPGG